MDHAPEVDPPLVWLGLEGVRGRLLGLEVAGVCVERLDGVRLEAELGLVRVVHGKRESWHGLAELDRVFRLPCDGEYAGLDVAVDAQPIRYLDHALVLGHGRLEGLVEGLSLVFGDHARQHHDAVEAGSRADLGDLLECLLAPLTLLWVGVIDVHSEVAAEQLRDFEAVFLGHAADVVRFSLGVVDVGDEPLGNVGSEGAPAAGSDVNHVEAHLLHDLARRLKVELSERKR